MINFRKLTLRNFLSYGNLNSVIDLTPKGTTLILGNNLDARSANGAGKSVMLNAIAYALYNKPIANISKERLINRTNSSKTTSMEVKLEFEVNENIYEISRARGESYSITLTENGKDITPDSIASTDRKIVELIGISYELFCIAIVFTGPDQPFLDLPISQQRTIIEELFKITALSEKAVKLKEKIGGIQGEIKIQDALLIAQQTSADQQVKRIADAETRVVKWESDRTLNIGPLNEKIAKLKLVDFKTQQKLFDDLQSKTKEKEKILTGQLTNAADIKLLEKQITDLNGQIKHLQDDKCPYCMQGFEGAGDKLPTLLEEVIVKDSARALSIDDNISFTKEIGILNSSINEIKNSLLYTSLQELLKDQASIMSLEEKLEDLNVGENPHIEAFEKLLLEDIKEPNFDQIDELKRDLEHHQFLLKLLTDKNSFIRKRIINKTIPFLNEQINEYTTKLGLPHKVKFDSDMSCQLSEWGRILDFGNLSSGEKKRVNLALSLAFRDVLQRLHSPFSSLWMDEMDAGLDASGVEAAFDLIRKKAKADNMGIWIISHRPEADGAFSRSITITKSGGFSTVEV